MHLVDYLYEDYHDARSLEHKVRIKSAVLWNVTPCGLGNRYISEEPAALVLSVEESYSLEM